MSLDSIRLNILKDTNPFLVQTSTPTIIVARLALLFGSQLSADQQLG